jgi:hypothetical protein
MKEQTPCTNLFFSSLKSSVTDFAYSFLLFSDKMTIIVALWSSYSLQFQKMRSFFIVEKKIQKWPRQCPLGPESMFLRLQAVTTTEEVTTFAFSIGQISFKEVVPSRESQANYSYRSSL